MIILKEFFPSHIHLETSNPYELLDQPRLKLPNGTWVNGVLYRNDKNVLCVRSLESFNEKFRRIE